jgi:hypothetical protein
MTVSAIGSTRGAKGIARPSRDCRASAPGAPMDLTVPGWTTRRRAVGPGCNTGGKRTKSDQTARGIPFRTAISAQVSMMNISTRCVMRRTRSVRGIAIQTPASYESANDGTLERSTQLTEPDGTNATSSERWHGWSPRWSKGCLSRVSNQSSGRDPGLKVPGSVREVG